MNQTEVTTGNSCTRALIDRSLFFGMCYTTLMPYGIGFGGENGVSLAPLPFAVTLLQGCIISWYSPSSQLGNLHFSFLLGEGGAYSLGNGTLDYISGWHKKIMTLPKSLKLRSMTNYKAFQGKKRRREGVVAFSNSSTNRYFSSATNRQTLRLRGPWETKSGRRILALLSSYLRDFASWHGFRKPSRYAIGEASLVTIPSVYNVE